MLYVLPASKTVEDRMRKTIIAIAAAASISAAAIAIPTPAEARCLGCWVGAGIATGIVAGALASRAYGYGYPAYGYGYPAYGYPPTPTRRRITGATRRQVIIRAANARRIWDTAEPQVGAAAEGASHRHLPRIWESVEEV